MIVVVILTSLLIAVLIIFAYLLGVTVGEARMENEAAHWEREYDDACEEIERRRRGEA